MNKHASVMAAPYRVPFYLQAVRTILRKLNYHFSPDPLHESEPIDPERLRAAENALRKLPVPDQSARSYLEKHLGRLARTLALVPLAGSGSRALELGCYMQITPFLNRLCGYQEVHGAYYGPLGRVDRKRIDFPDGPFACEVSHFDAERDRFPYPDQYFDLVVAAEIIEHMLLDPMHLIVESRRVLRDGGYLIVTTPNVGSITSVAKTLEGRDNPQIFFLYKRPRADEEHEIGHMREYTAHELRATVTAGGFEVLSLFTTFIPEFASHLPLLAFLRESGYATENRGEQMFCLAVKRSSLLVDRYPWFIYSD